MKNIVFIIAVSLLHTINAAANAGQQLRVDEGCIVYDADNNLIRAVNHLAGSVRVLVSFCEFSSDNVQEVFNQQVLENRTRLAEISHGLPEAVISRMGMLFDGMVRRIRADYDPLMRRMTEARARLNPLFGGENHMCFPDPLSTSFVVDGQEQAACNYAKDLSNAIADLAQAKTLLVGLRRIDDIQIFLFVSGVKQVVRGGKLYVQDPLLQEFYSSYFDGREPREIYGLEARVANNLLTDRDSATLTYYDSLTYNPAKEYYPDEVKRQVVLDKQVILQALARRAGPALPSPAVPVPVVKKVRMFTEADDVILSGISKAMETIDTVLKATGKTPSGWSSAERIMDYGSLNNSSISQEMRSNIEALLSAQFKTRAVVVPNMQTFNARLPYNKIMHGLQQYATEKKWDKAPDGGEVQKANLSGLRAVIADLDVWVDNMQLQFEVAERIKISNVLLAMSNSNPQNATNEYYRFISALWKLRALYNYYTNWNDNAERGIFLDAVKTIAHMNFIHVSMQGKNDAGDQLNCLIGARGRTFLVDLSIVEFFRDKHPEFAVQQ